MTKKIGITASKTKKKTRFVAVPLKHVPIEKPAKRQAREDLNKIA